MFFVGVAEDEDAIDGRVERALISLGWKRVVGRWKEPPVRLRSKDAISLPVNASKILVRKSQSGTCILL